MLASPRIDRYVGFAVTFLCVVSALGGEAQAQESEEGAALTHVKSKYVCMVTDQRFETPQIPVTVRERTYYGCCQGCVSRLQRDPTMRRAVDPVSRDTVDKAAAVIGMGPDGQVYYFESEANMRAFDPTAHDGDTQHREDR